MKTCECYWPFIIFTIWRVTPVAGFKSFSETELTHMKQFREFMVKFNKTYESKAEEVKRFGIFKSNLKIIEKMNGDENEKAEFGVTMFSDLSDAEFEDQMLISFNETIEYQAMEEPVSKSLSSIIRRAPSSFSWTDHESYPPVESQGSCRICCVFSMVGALSIMYSVHQGRPINLSKQQLVDCNSNIVCERGGLTYPEVYRAIKNTYLATERVYPYVGTDGHPCNENNVEEGVASLSDYRNPTTESAILTALRNGPLPSRVVGSYLRQYTGNVLTNCPNQRGTHGVVIVGYGEEEGVPYYLVRNSWGSNYGILGGHAKIKRGTCATHEVVYKLTMKIKGEGCCG
ncbi:unnamed protein product [Bemisia tabaci]|uniref:Uncharacterized protein n=1 Tax=Bemisia tabaci TaxID=7038 RepID=A0A9P0AJ54_BEMTA|nr:unnamed protein product [Bemisia tabaci]